MHANAFDRYLAGTSPIHRLDARVKVVVTLLFILSNALLPNGAWLGFLLALAIVLGISQSAGLGLDFAIRRSFVALPFALAAITVLAATPGQPVWVIRASPLLQITDAGIIRFFSIVIRSLLSVQMAILLTATTPFPDIIHALRHLRLPAGLVAVISFMYRYLFVLADEVMRLLRARTARSASRNGVTPPLRWRARVAGNMAGQLFIRSFERSDRVYNAMLARGYRGHLMTLHPHEMQRGDWLAGFLAVLSVLIVQIAGRWPQ